jgi:predicted GNAT family N-acyltransferase
VAGSDVSDLVLKTAGFYGKDRSDIIAVRYTVFTLEQKVDPKIDLDGEDSRASHVLVHDGTTPVGTGRILTDGHIGRVAVAKSHRGRGVGEMIMEALVSIARVRGDERVFLGGQIQARGFYQTLEFLPYGPVYEEAGIEHRHMEKRLTCNQEG